MPDRSDDRLSRSPTRPHDQQRTERPDDDRSYTLDDLTATTGITVRTVRYYISEGLLPPPHGAGPGTRYTQQHLDRLLLIGALKDAYLPLKEIRRRIAAMTDEEIHEAVEQMLARTGENQDQDIDADTDAVAFIMLTEPPAESGRPGRSSAASYIEAVLREESPGSTVKRVTVRRPPGNRADERGHRPMRFPGANESIEPVASPDGEPARWRRLAISPEAELLIEEAAFQRRREQIETLVAWARRILETT